MSVCEMEKKIEMKLVEDARHSFHSEKSHSRLVQSGKCVWHSNAFFYLDVTEHKIKNEEEPARNLGNGLENLQKNLEKSLLCNQMRWAFYLCKNQEIRHIQSSSPEEPVSFQAIKLSTTKKKVEIEPWARAMNNRKNAINWKKRTTPAYENTEIIF